MRTHHLVLAAALASFVALPTFAAEPSLPQTGSAQDITVPHALPSTAAEVPHGGQHLTSPSGTQANAAERGPVAQNALPGRATDIGETRPHADVTAPQGVVPSRGSEQGANPRNSSR